MAYAETMFPEAISECIIAKTDLRAATSGILSLPGLWRTRASLPEVPLNSGDISLRASAVVMAKDISIGGTFKFLKVPLMESLPPIEGRPKAACIFRAPRRAAKGLPHETGEDILSKYSWNENLI